MKVLVLSHMYPYQREPGFGLFVHDQLVALSSRVDVIVVSPTPLAPPVLRRLNRRWASYASKPSQTRIDDIHVLYPRYANPPGVHGFPLAAFSYYWMTRRLVIRLKDTFDFDLIHAHAICPDGFAAARIGFQVGVPAVCTVHGSDIYVYPHRTRLTQLVTRAAIRKLHTIITVSAALEQEVLALETPRRAIRVVPNGVDTQLFKPTDKALARNALSLPQDVKILLYASRLDEDKGLRYLLAALRIILDQGNLCLLILLGKGAYRRQLERQIAEMNLEHNVILAGQRPHAEIAKWMGACDLVVHPSLSEGSPLPVYEALACGRPVVASRVGGTPELIPVDDLGLLVPAADHVALAKAILSGLRRKWDIERISRHGQQYTWRNAANYLQSLYGEILAGVTR